MCINIFTNIENLKKSYEKNNSFCVKCSNLFVSKNDLKPHKNNCNICD